MASAILFFLIFCYFANRTNLENFDWSAVLTNSVNSVLLSRTNPAISIIDTKGTNGLVATSRHFEEYTTFAHNFSAEGHLSSTNGAPPPDRITKELAVRMTWAISALGFAFLCLVIVFCSIGVLNETLQLPTSALAGCAVAVLVIFAIFYELSDGPIPTIAGGKAADQLFQIMENDRKAEAASLNKLLRDEHSADLTKIGIMVNSISTGAKVGLVFVAIAGCCILMVMRGEQDEFAKIGSPSTAQIALAKACYERRVQTTVGLLQITACCLVSAVVEVFLLYTMASYYVVPILQSNVQYFAQSLATTCGLVYSGLLIAIYLPLIAGQMAIGRELIASHGGNTVTGEKTTFLAQIDGTDPKKAPMINALITVFAPVLVAFLTKLASVLSSYF